MGAPLRVKDPLRRQAQPVPKNDPCLRPIGVFIRTLPSSPTGGTTTRLWQYRLRCLPGSTSLLWVAAIAAWLRGWSSFAMACQYPFCMLAATVRAPAHVPGGWSVAGLMYRWLCPRHWEARGLPVWFGTWDFLF